MTTTHTKEVTPMMEMKTQRKKRMKEANESVTQEYTRAMKKT